MSTASTARAPAGPGRRRRAPGPRRAVLPARQRPPGRRGAHHRLRRPRRCGCCRTLEVDAVFLDIQMPGLTGLELAQVLARFKTPPPVVFVTAHDEHAVDAFELQRGRLRAQAGARRTGSPRPSAGSSRAPAARRRRPTTRSRSSCGGVTRFVARSDIRYVEAQGDYARLHTADGSHLVRTPADHAGGGVARRPGSCGSTARCWSSLAARRRGPHRGAAGCTVVVGGQRAAGQPPAHPRAARPAGAPHPSGRDP